MLFEWDDAKERINKMKHGIDFDTASSVFSDPLRIEIFDNKHSTLSEERYMTIGKINGATYILSVVYTERNESIRLISARHANAAERKAYYDNSKIY